MTTTRDRIPDQAGSFSPEAEESVLGAVLLSPADVVDVVIDLLRPDDFYRPQHQLVFEAVCRLYEANRPIDAVTVTEALRASGQLERIGGLGFLTALIDSVPTVSNVDYYAGIVREQALRRRLRKAGGEVGELAMDAARPVAEVLDRAEQVVLAVGEHNGGEGPTTAAPLLPEVLSSFEGEPGPSGLITGFLDLDRQLGGLQPGNLVIVAGRPSMGKSALALNIAHRVAKRGEPVAMFSLEMSRLELLQRLVCSTARVNSKHARDRELSADEWARVMDAAGVLDRAPLYLDESARLTVSELRAKARRIKRHAGGLALLVVDYMQLMDAAGENRQQEIAAISRGLKGLARDLEVPVIGVSQLNRAVEAREDKRPRLGDLRESGALEQDADIVVFLYREEYYHPDKSGSKGLAEANVAKHRSGATGRVDLAFMAEYAAFEDLQRA